MTDQKAIHAMRTGSQDALAWLIDKYGAYVSTIVWNIIGGSMSMADVEEVSSDVFLAVWNQANYIRTSSIRGYLASIARNKAKNKLRDAGCEVTLDENMILLESIHAEDIYENKEVKQVVRRAVNNMKEPEREILLRYYFYYQTMDVISKEMGMNLSTVKTKLRRAKEFLKQSLMQEFR